MCIYISIYIYFFMVQPLQSQTLLAQVLGQAALSRHVVPLRVLPEDFEVPKRSRDR